MADSRRQGKEPLPVPFAADPDHRVIEGRILDIEPPHLAATESANGEHDRDDGQARQVRSRLDLWTESGDHRQQACQRPATREPNERVLTQV